MNRSKYDVQTVDACENHLTCYVPETNLGLQYSIEVKGCQSVGMNIVRSA
jgi:hypothetical protein